MGAEKISLSSFKADHVVDVRRKAVGLSGRMTISEKRKKSVRRMPGTFLKDPRPMSRVPALTFCRTVAGFRIEYLDADLGPLGAELLDGLRQDVRRDEQPGTDRQTVARLPDALSDARQGTIELLQAPVGHRKQLPALCRQRHVTSRAIEEPESDLSLELPYQQTQPGRRDEERFRCPCEVVVLCHEQERAELPRREINH